jgi:hypothetical protein
VKAKEDFIRSTASFTYHQKVEERHEGYVMFQRRNYIPGTVTNYWRILNDPPLAALERCIPVSLYYAEICKDSPGYIPPQHQGSHHRHGSSGSGHSNQDNHRSAQIRSSKPKFTNHATSRHKPPHTNHNKSASYSRHESRGNSVWHASSSAERQNSLKSPQEITQDLATLVSWSNERIGNDDRQYPHRPDLMTLDDLAEINRLTELIGNIRSGNPPSYFISLREAEVHNIRRVILQRSNNTQEQEAFYSRDSAGKELEEIFDTNQIKLIQAKINSIRGAALEQEENITDDGPSGQEVH